MVLVRQAVPRWLAVAFGVALAVVLVACGGPFKDAVKRGDQFASAGMWDKAATEYEAALKIKPGSTDVEIKLKQMRLKLSGLELERGKALMARGEIDAGLAVLQQAARLSPDSTDAQRALSDANAQALEKAKELLATPDSRRAFDLTQLVLAGSPNDPRARATDEQVRDTLAEQSYERAEKFRRDKKHGNALIELAACVTYRPGFRDAKALIGELKAALQAELTYHVVLERFSAGPAGEQEIASRLKPELVAQAFDERIPLRVVATAPAKDSRGVRIGGGLSAYRFGPAKTSTRNAECTYVRGVDMVPNPRRADAERQVAEAERRLASVERDVDREQQDVDRKQADVDRLTQELSREQADEDRAQEDLRRCEDRARNSSSSSSSPCSSEQSRLSSAQGDVRNIRSRLQSAQGWVSSARQSLQWAQQRRGSARQEVERERRELQSVPALVEQPHHERENYAVESRSIDASVTLTLRAETLLDRNKLLDSEAFPQVIRPIVDEGWVARPATCPASGKRINLPNEPTLRGELVKMTIATLREKVQTMYESYRTRFLADARRLESSGAPEEAVESYVRYLLTGLRNIDAKDGQQIGEFLRKTRGFGRIDLLGGL